MARITVYMTIPTDDLDRDFVDDADLGASLKARLSEIFDRNGNPVAPHFVGFDVEEDD